MAYLGLDCGGTRTRWCWRPAGRADGDGPGVQPATQGVAAAAAALLQQVRRAAPALDFDAAVAAVAGAGDPALRVPMLAALRDATPRPIAVVGDVLAAAAGALGNDTGVLVWAGTGSFAVARAGDGALHRTGGRGYLLGDQGSAFDLVRRAAAAAVLAADGLGHPTQLGAVLAAAFGVAGPQHLGAALQRAEPGAVASRLPLVLQCAAAGDPVADQLLDEGMEALAMVANAALRQAHLSWPQPVVVGGGVLVGSAALRERLAARLAVLGAPTPSIATADTAAHGAALLAEAWHRRRAPYCEQVDHGAL